MAQVKGSYAIASKLDAPVPERADAAFVTAMHVSLLAAAGAALVAAITVVVPLSSPARRGSFARKDIGEDQRRATIPSP